MVIMRTPIISLCSLVIIPLLQELLGSSGSQLHHVLVAAQEVAVPDEAVLGGSSEGEPATGGDTRSGAQQKLQQMLNWAIGKSDPGKVKELAEQYTASGQTIEDVYGREVLDQLFAMQSGQAPSGPGVGPEDKTPFMKQLSTVLRDQMAILQKHYAGHHFLTPNEVENFISDSGVVPTGKRHLTHDETGEDVNRKRLWSLSTVMLTRAEMRDKSTVQRRVKTRDYSYVKVNDKETDDTTSTRREKVEALLDEAAAEINRSSGGAVSPTTSSSSESSTTSTTGGTEEPEPGAAGATSRMNRDEALALQVPPGINVDELSKHNIQLVRQHVVSADPYEEGRTPLGLHSSSHLHTSTSTWAAVLKRKKVAELERELELLQHPERQTYEEERQEESVVHPIPKNPPTDGSAEGRDPLQQSGAGAELEAESAEKSEKGDEAADEEESIEKQGLAETYHNVMKILEVVEDELSDLNVAQDAEQNGIIAPLVRLLHDGLTCGDTLGKLVPQTDGMLDVETPQYLGVEQDQEMQLELELGAEADPDALTHFRFNNSPPMVLADRNANVNEVNKSSSFAATSRSPGEDNAARNGEEVDARKGPSRPPSTPTPTSFSTTTTTSMLAGRESYGVELSNSSFTCTSGSRDHIEEVEDILCLVRWRMGERAARTLTAYLQNNFPMQEDFLRRYDQVRRWTRREQDGELVDERQNGEPVDELLRDIEFGKPRGEIESQLEVSVVEKSSEPLLQTWAMRYARHDCTNLMVFRNFWGMLMAILRGGNPAVLQKYQFALELFFHSVVERFRNSMVVDERKTKSPEPLVSYLGPLRLRHSRVAEQNHFRQRENAEASGRDVFPAVARTWDGAIAGKWESVWWAAVFTPGEVQRHWLGMVKFLATIHMTGPAAGPTIIHELEVYNLPPGDEGVKQYNERRATLWNNWQLPELKPGQRPVPSYALQSVGQTEKEKKGDDRVLRSWVKKGNPWFQEARERIWNDTDSEVETDADVASRLPGEENALKRLYQALRKLRPDMFRNKAIRYVEEEEEDENVGDETVAEEGNSSDHSRDSEL